MADSSAKTISVGITKGGSGKSTVSSILCHLLSKKYKVLAVDADGQGNLTQLLTGVEDIFEFTDNSVYNAILDEDASNYIYQINKKLHILPGDENINTLGPYFHIELRDRKVLYQHTLQKALEKVKHLYDFIIIDCPPARGEICIVSLTASDYVLIPFETSAFCFSSLKSYLETVEKVQDHLNSDLKVIGILRSMIDSRRKDNEFYSNLVAETYPDYTFDTIIKRTAAVGRLPSFGFDDNPDLKAIIKQYQPFYKELLDNVR
ncbi:chromosome partitioning protein [Paenibacillus sp. PastF-3]|uniref:ParA family protein n=1 Tax=unclassified Paenibacillus TaxID=185978 RepID=UPI000BA0F967|nr:MULTISPECIES: ParA family protein [unclassified Paenibacillus]MDH6372881.1 chromosome partitioning protein [Paenibacillus sp. PastF-3]OZQ85772.1 hypothetical protein CA598_20120 [Paenibacillus sp. VTT E-133291]